MKKYEFELEKYDRGFRVTNYKDDDGNFKCTATFNKEDKIIVENLKGLLKKLNSDKLNVKIEIN